MRDKAILVALAALHRRFVECVSLWPSHAWVQARWSSGSEGRAFLGQIVRFRHTMVIYNADRRLSRCACGSDRSSSPIPGLPQSPLNSQERHPNGTIQVLEKRCRRNMESFAQFLYVGFVEVTFLVQDFRYDTFRAKN